MSDIDGDPLHLATRSGLPEDMRVLLADFPRERWDETTLAEMARFWLSIHNDFRRHHDHMLGIVSHWRSGHSDLTGLHDRLVPTLQQFLQHLDMHHRIESGQYFPIMRRVDPRIAHGIDLLDRDHDVVHGALDQMFQAAIAFNQGLTSKAPDSADRAALLADAVTATGPLLHRHLGDEEEIVIPLIATRGDEIG